ncbi:MAG: hypothetical protein ACE5IK_11165 [Acidobacteriota bacterium]
MSASTTRWAICPVEDCTVAIEFDPDESLYCPTCEMEMISECPSCRAPIDEEEGTLCSRCGASLKE